MVKIKRTDEKTFSSNLITCRNEETIEFGKPFARLWLYLTTGKQFLLLFHQFHMEHPIEKRFYKQIYYLIEKNLFYDE